MAGVLGPAWADELSRFLFTTDAVTPPFATGHVYMAVFHSDPLGVAPDEVSDPAYTRIDVTDTIAVIDGEAVNQHGVEFAQASGAYRLPVSHVALCDTQQRGSGGVVASIAFEQPQAVAAGGAVSFAALKMVLRLSNELSSEYGSSIAMRWLLQHCTDVEAPTRPTEWWLSLRTAAPVVSGVESAASEVSGAGYARVQTTGASSASRNSSDGVIRFSSTVSFQASTAEWGNVTHVSIHSASAGVGNLIGSARLTNQLYVRAGMSVTVQPGSMSISVE